MRRPRPLAGAGEQRVLAGTGRPADEEDLGTRHAWGANAVAGVSRRARAVRESSTFFVNLAVTACAARPLNASRRASRGRVYYCGAATGDRAGPILLRTLSPRLLLLESALAAPGPRALGLHSDFTHAQATAQRHRTRVRLRKTLRVTRQLAALRRARAARRRGKGMQRELLSAAVYISSGAASVATQAARAARGPPPRAADTSRTRPRAPSVKIVGPKDDLLEATLAAARDAFERVDRGGSPRRRRTRARGCGWCPSCR